MPAVTVGCAKHRPGNDIVAIPRPAIVDDPPLPNRINVLDGVPDVFYG
jgi:hypothetical protein